MTKMSKYKYKAEVVLEFARAEDNNLASTLLEAGAKAVMYGAGSYTKQGGFGGVVLAQDPRITLELIKPRRKRK